jgi:HEAT repeat protein
MAYHQVKSSSVLPPARTKKVKDDVIDEENTELDEPGAPPRTGPSRKYPWAILVVIALFVVAPFLSWYGTWFGRPLSDATMEEYLRDTARPRDVQHALAQVANHIERGDQSVKRWYPAVIGASGNASPQVRRTAAWVMGQDNQSEQFHSALSRMLGDQDSGVRHNAALALVRFGDAQGRPELIAMLQPTTLRSEVDGAVELVIREEGIPVDAGTLLMRIRQDDGRKTDVFSPGSGRVESIAVGNGARVNAGAELLTLSPDSEQVRNALVALYLVGRAEDVPAIQRYTRPLPGMPDAVQKQAVATTEAIRERNP